MKKIKRVILISIPILAIIAAILISSRKNEVREPAVIKPFIPEPNIPNDLKGPVQIKSSVNPTEFNFPQEAPLLQQKNKPLLSEEEAINISKKFNFKSKPFIGEDALRGTAYIWSETTGSLNIYLKRGTVEYSLNGMPKIINKQLDDETKIQIAKDFVSNKLLTPTDNFEFVSLTYLKGSNKNSLEGLDVTNQKEATFTQINFSQKVSQYSILNFSGQETPIYVWLMSDGTVYKAHIQRLGEIAQTETKYPLKNYSDIISSLDKAIVVSFNNGNAYLPFVPTGFIKNIDVSEINLAYLLEKPDS